MNLSEEKYRSLVENLPDIVWTVDQEGNTTFVSPNIEKVLGYTLEEIYEAGDSLWPESIHPEDIEKVKNAYESFFKLNKRLDVECRIKRKDGSWIWLHNRAAAPYEKDGVLYGDGLSSDITRRKDAEEKILLLQTLVMAVSTSKDLHDALVITLEKVCNATGWDYGEAWMPNPEGTYLVRDHTFYSKATGLEKFSELSSYFSFPPGVGLPGQVWSTRQPVWIRDITCDPNYPRATIAKHVGLKTGIGIPILVDAEVVAIIAFYMFASVEKDERLTCL
ncbi:MAG TPA: PAS domain S-box protein, partial [Candidatus Brocadiaceae bacterium]